MANITQQPSEWNLAYIPNVWTLSDIGTADSFYLAVNIDGNDVAEFRQPPNPAGVAHFDVSKVLQSYLKPDFVEETTFAAETKKETITYRIKYGTVTNNVIDTPVNFSIGFKHAINGYGNWRDLNWNSTPEQFRGQLQLCESGPGDNLGRLISGQFLNNYPLSQFPLRSSSYHTLSFFNRLENWNDGTLWPGTVIQPAYVEIKYYTSQNALIQTSIYSIDAQRGLGPRTDFDGSTMASYTDDQLIGTIGAGPQNLKDAGLWPNGGIAPQIWNQVVKQWNNNQNIWNLAGTGSALVDRYEINIYSVDWCYWEANGAPQDAQATTLIDYLGELIYTYNFKVSDHCVKFTPITMSYINSYGVKEYFTWDRRNTKTVNTNRTQYYKSNASYSDSAYTINQHSGGRTIFNSEVSTEMMLSSNWMTDEESIWLQELFTSPSTQIFVDGNWEPVVISQSSYDEKTYARDMMFKHNISVQFANNKTVQRG